MSELLLMKGNEAFAEAAIRAGCRYYFGYPITPQNELIEYMSRNLQKNGGSFVQAESELAAINMAYGGAVAGGRVLVSSSSPGIALMQEGLSFLCSTELPLVIMNVSRGGPGVGSIQPGQADYLQATRGGGNGDYHLIVYGPSSLQEAIDMLQDAFETADKYRNPVMLLVDGILGQMMEPVRLPEHKTDTTVKDWALSGHNDSRKHNVVKSLYLKPEGLEEKLAVLKEKYDKAEAELTDYETYNLENAKTVLVSYGSTARICKEAIRILGEEGQNVGLIRPRSLWPFPYEAFDEIGNTTKHLISVELSEGQLIQDIQIGAKGRWPISLINRVGGILLSPMDIVNGVRDIMGVR